MHFILFIWLLPVFKISSPNGADVFCDYVEIPELARSQSTGIDRPDAGSSSFYDHVKEGEIRTKPRPLLTFYPHTQYRGRLNSSMNDTILQQNIPSFATYSHSTATTMFKAISATFLLLIVAQASVAAPQTAGPQCASDSDCGYGLSCCRAIPYPQCFKLPPGAVC
ncbi:hypothetical protein BDQ17DRAFT_1368504 [Cyathus striatus]|nr:hypothetical protein BDQ17DRAFT_1368504 [Cyathus striatus]